MKTTKIKINPRPLHKLPKGHPTHLSGSGVHQDKRTKRKRGGKSANQQAVVEQAIDLRTSSYYNPKNA